MSLAISSGIAYLSSGRFASARRMIASTPSDSSGRSLRGGGTGSMTCFIRIAIIDGPSNGGLPISM